MKILLVLHLLLLSTIAVAQTRDFTRWVNPFIGTGGHGHTFPGATVPFGMVQLSPDTRIDNWDGSSGYHYSDDIIYGFSHTHLSGTGIPDGCDILFMPTVGEPESFAKEGHKSVNGYASKFSHANEKAEPGYYSVRLDDDGILVELTSTTRVGIHRYTFPESAAQRLIIDLRWRDRVLKSALNSLTGTRVEGFRRSSSWAKDQTVYFVAEFSRPFHSVRIKRPAVDAAGNYAALRFDQTSGDSLLIKVAISFVSIEGARKNLQKELPHWDFDRVRADAKAAWNKELSKIEVSGGTDDQTTIFYTALYHTMIHPNVFNDVDGKYLGHDRKIHQLPGYSVPVSSAPPSGSSAPSLGVRRSSASPKGFNNFMSGYAATDGRRSREDVSETRRKSGAFPHTEGQSPKKPPKGGTQNATRENDLKSQIENRKSEHYTVFSLWDTFRATHPLYTIIDQKRTVDYINTFIRIYEQGGRLPVWELWGEETDTMIGYHAVSVIADAMAKGIQGFDYEKAYQAARHSAQQDHFGLATYKRRGYISSEDENESVSKTLEYAYNDWCLAQMLYYMYPYRDVEFPDDERGRQLRNDYLEFTRRASSFNNLFDPATGFMRPRLNGGFLKPFAPNEVTFSYTEANAWQYSFFVPHGIWRLSRLMGGEEKLIARLDELFSTEQKLAGREQPDITGLIGQYAHGNEPSHHIAYMYDYVGQPWKTQKLVRRIMDEFYRNAPDGLIGNEDCGQMSAWYVLSASGFYSVTPGFALYAFGTPLFPEITYRLENGKTFTIKAPKVSAKNIYIKSATLDGKKLVSPHISHHWMMRGGSLEFEMAAEPVPDAFPRRPISETVASYAPVPIIDADRVFTTWTTVKLSSVPPDNLREVRIHYTIDGTEPTDRSPVYSSPFIVDRNTTVKAIAIPVGRFTYFYRSRIAEATLSKRSNNWTVKILSPYSTQYTGGGDDAIVDGLRGNANFASGEWQGYQGKTFEAVIDLQRETAIRSIGGSFLQVARSWIWMPERIEFEISTDGLNFRRVADLKTNFPLKEMAPVTKHFTKAIGPTRARYVRVRAYNIGKIPSWHPGAGGDPWIFVDEIFVR